MLINVSELIIGVKIYFEEYKLLLIISILSVMEEVISAPEEFKFLDKIKYLFSKPNLFFEKIKSEKGIKNSLLMFIVVGLFGVGVGLVFSFGVEIFSPSIYGGGFYSFFGPLFSMGLLLVEILITFLYAGLIYGGVKIFKGEGSYSDSYNVFTYSMVSFLILSLIPLIGLLAVFYFPVLMVIGVSKVHNISKMKSALICLWPLMLLLAFLVFVFSIFLFGF